MRENKNGILSLPKYIVSIFMDKKLDFRVRLFNLLAIAGTLISAIMAVIVAFIGPISIVVFINAASTILSFSLLYYSYRTGKYQRCYIITIVVIFMMIFPVLFITGGGYHGGMPVFFVFGVLFTVFMLEGKIVAVLTIVEILLYTGLFFFAYYFPERIEYYDSELDIMVDILVSVLAVSLTIGVTMFLHFRLYNQQQKELEAAREEALRLSQAKSNFLANMSHEIRTPINVILGMNEMILREGQTRQILGYGQNIQSAGKTLLHLISNILDVSKIESGKLTVDDQKYHLYELIEELSIIGMELAGRYGLMFQTEVDENIPAVLIGDSIHIKQIAVNFLSNAAKYTRQGNVTLSIQMKKQDNSRDIVLIISVKDTGTGISEENIPKLFEAFTRGEMLHNQYIEGTGLGLAIAKELTDLLGGEVHVDSELGVGSVFTVEIPQKVHDDTTLDDSRYMDATYKKNGHSFIAPKATMLIVDDNSENLQVIRSLLSRTLIQIDTAISGEQCLNAVKEKRYDLIIMDYMMPEMDGERTLACLKELPDFDIPVIALTANAQPDVVSRLINAGFKECLLKPIASEKLEKAICSLLPEEMVSISENLPERSLTEAQRNKASESLLQCGVYFEEAMKLFGGNAVQYKKLVELFLQNYSEARGDIQKLVATEDWHMLRFAAHSLKSKARAVGAEDLSVTAEKIERRCEQKLAAPDEYMQAVLFTLFREWDYAVSGLSDFVDKSDDWICESVQDAETEIVLDDLLSMLRHHRQPDALNMLDRMINAERNADSAKVLREIRKNVDDIEFTEAQNLLEEYMGGAVNE